MGVCFDSDRRCRVDRKRGKGMSEDERRGDGVSDRERKRGKAFGLLFAMSVLGWGVLRSLAKAVASGVSREGIPVQSRCEEPPLAEPLPPEPLRLDRSTDDAQSLQGAISILKLRRARIAQTGERCLLHSRLPLQSRLGWAFSFSIGLVGRRQHVAGRHACSLSRSFSARHWCCRRDG